MTSAVLHIGTTKTGTSFLQGILLANRETLREAGVIYPDLDGRLNQNNLALAFNSTTGRRHEQVGVTDREATRAALAHQFGSDVQAGQRWILSTENASKLKDDDAAALYGFLSEYFDDITVIVYIRRREFLLASRFSQQVKDGGGSNLTWDEMVTSLARENPTLLVDRWAKVTGREPIVRPYLESFKKSPSNLLEDFCSAVALNTTLLPATNEAQEPILRNQSLSAEGVEVLRILNQYLPTTTIYGKANMPLRRRVVLRTQEITSDVPLKAPDDVLDQATQQFQPSNEELVSRFADSPAWHNWLEQRATGVGSQTPAMTAARAMELLLQLSKPVGPLDFTTTDWRPRYIRPTPPPPLTQVIRRKLTGRK